MPLARYINKVGKADTNFILSYLFFILLDVSPLNYNLKGEFTHIYMYKTVKAQDIVRAKKLSKKLKKY